MQIKSFFSKVGFVFFKGIAWLITKTPFRILYIISDVVFFVLYHIVKYRRKVVTENLENSFPEKTKEELKIINRKYYHHLSDLILEVLKIPGMNEDIIKHRAKYINPGLVSEMIKHGKNLIFISGHLGNFEWIAQSLPCWFKGSDHYNGIVKPLSDPRFEYFMTHTLREAFYKNTAIDYKHAFRTLASQRGSINITYIVADQTPHKDEINYWTQFLNQDTPVFLGTEKIAKALDLAVFYVHVSKVKRGFYELRLELITDNPKNTSEFEITEKHVHLLEQDIILQPEIWLWSHRRWKYKNIKNAEKSHESN
jgi:Kdo2-lipid IVA lauroyltransferase/acyltransferase